ncbi:hypothetical protein GSI_14711 [Ganoderma sinense ZZ0214-1]|uniref:Uncharacterized protein n=1 Tax=Ganoderma sinense ZZ0214-1 TaxID=1077348 RepID=A0A2G8RPG1_9APHY|nr:hypothetical protein GSI_14711 [Ganoderma sinense ZZ0214-1]
MGNDDVVSLVQSDNFIIVTSSLLTGQIAARACTIAADMSVLVITWTRTFPEKIGGARMKLRSGIAICMLQDGTIYFGILLIIHVISLALIRELQFVNVMSQWIQAFTAVLACRFILDLHESFAAAIELRIGVPKTPDVAPSDDNTFSTWFLDHAPLILGSALSMFASNIFLYAFLNSGIRAIWHVSPHALSSPPSRIQMLAIAAPRSVCAAYAWTTQLARHIYLLFLYALCQAVILPCLIGSQLLGWAGRVWFVALCVLYTAFRILFTVAFDVLVVDPGLACLAILAAKGLTSSLRRTSDWTTDLHEAAVQFVGGTQSTLPLVHSPECSSTASPSRLGDSLVGPSRASARTIFDSASSRTKKCAVTANFVIAYEVEIAREETRFRFPVATTLHLRIALAGQREGRSNDGSASPGMIDVLQQSESDDGRHLFDRRDPGDGWLVTEAGKTPRTTGGQGTPQERISRGRESVFEGK